MRENKKREREKERERERERERASSAVLKIVGSQIGKMVILKQVKKLFAIFF